MPTPIRNCGSFFYPSLSVFYEDYNKECPLTKFEQFAKCIFGEICTHCLTILPYIWN